MSGSSSSSDHVVVSSGHLHPSDLSSPTEIKLWRNLSLCWTDCRLETSGQRADYDSTYFNVKINLSYFLFLQNNICVPEKTSRKVLKVAQVKNANYGCKDEGNDDGVSGQSVISQSVASQSVFSKSVVS